jgi:hypothetical protein
MSRGGTNVVRRGRKPTNTPRGKSLSISPAKEPGATAFDYQDVPEENRDEVHAIVGRIRKSLRRVLESAVAIGRDLSRARDLVGHGNFLAWLKREFPGSERTAQSYMDLARHFEGITAQFADLNLTTAKALVATSTPAVVRDELFARAEDGEKITSEEVRQRIAEAKDPGQKPTAKSREVPPDRAEHAEVGPTPELRSGDEQTIRRAIIQPPVSPPRSVSPAEEVLEALLNFAHAVWKNSDRLGRSREPNVGPHCDPYDVAALAMKGMYDNRLRAISNCSEFAHDVAFAMLDKEASPLLRKMIAHSKR